MCISYHSSIKTSKFPQFPKLADITKLSRYVKVFKTNVYFARIFFQIMNVVSVKL